METADYPFYCLSNRWFLFAPQGHVQRTFQEKVSALPKTGENWNLDLLFNLD